MSPESPARSARRAPAPRLPLAEEVLRPTFRRERAAFKRGIWPVAGCDEAGRGPLAGPVVAAAVILDPARIPRGVDDSKKLDPETREKLHARICATAQVAVACAPPWRIDRAVRKIGHLTISVSGNRPGVAPCRNQATPAWPVRTKS